MMGISPEIGQISRFGVVGIVATLLHMVVVWTLIQTTALHPLLANLIAFGVAFGLSFAGHYFWTFASDLIWHQAALRFFLIAVSGFLLNTIILVGLIRAEWIDAQWAAVISTAIVPVFTYLLSRFWGFGE